MRLIASMLRNASLSICFIAVGSLPCLAANENSAPAAGAQNAVVPLPIGVSELRFNEFFKMPIGPRGLEPSKKLQHLNGKRVRIVGYMAQDEDPTPGLFILSSLPVNVAETSDGPADDLPPARLFVHMPKEDADKALAYRPGAWVLTGTLQLGNQQENNGRTSYARLFLDKNDADEALRNTPQPSTQHKKTQE